MKRRFVNLLKAVVAGAMFAMLFWKGIDIADQLDALTLTVITITALGVTYSAAPALFRFAGEISGGIMVLANFLNQHLLEPLKERQREEGRVQGEARGRARERERIRARLREQGYDLDSMLPPEEDEQSD